MTNNIVEDNPQIKYNIKNKGKDIFPKNIILYGPPGTGKTYQTVNYALAIIEQKPLEVIQTESRETCMKRFHHYREEGQIDFVTFHPAYSYEDFVQGIRPNTRVGNLIFEKRDGIFKIIAEKALQNFEGFTRQQNQVKVPFDELLNLLLSYKINPETEEIEIPLDQEHRIYKSIIIYDIREDALVYRRRTKNDIVKDESRLLALSKLNALYEGSDIKEAINEKYYEAVVEAVKSNSKALKKEEKTYDLKSYVIIIDEVNRAPIAQVFGELLSLLEEDKRYKAPNELVIKLPSGEDFVLPPNLYLVGTMNTSDKSIALLDYALRRRFSFRAIFPQEDLIEDKDLAKFLKHLNKLLLQEKKSDDYLIGHAYFIGNPLSELSNILNEKVIPLLQEYFLNRKDKIISVLAQAGVEIAEENYTLKFKNTNQNFGK